MLTAHYMNEWLDSVKPNLEKSTHEGLTIYVQKHIIPAIGQIPLEKLTTKAIQDYLASRAEMVSHRLHEEHYNYRPYCCKKFNDRTKRQHENAPKHAHVPTAPRSQNPITSNPGTR